MPSVEEYHIGWICALPEEFAAAQGMLDEEYDPIGDQDLQDDNNYVLGRVHKHNVVLVCLPAGVMGNNPAAAVAKDLVRTFPAIRFGLMVGIGGGIPNLSKKIDIRLGDVVVSQPDNTWGGVVQYDKGKRLSKDDFKLKGHLNKPPNVLLAALQTLKATHDRKDSFMSEHIATMLEDNPKMRKTGYEFPGADCDNLHCDICAKPIGASSQGDNGCGHQRRDVREDDTPHIHYGIIASGNSVIKDVKERQRLQDQFEALCVEMEAAGLLDVFPCLVIRGICDYADSYKNDEWHKYAAVTAAAFAKELLSYVFAKRVIHAKPIQEVLGR